MLQPTLVYTHLPISVILVVYTPTVRHYHLVFDSPVQILPLPTVLRVSMVTCGI